MSTPSPTEAWITGIGLVSSLGDGPKAHWTRLAAGGVAEPVVDEESAAPFPIHPLCDVDYETQIPKRGDRRQMGPWQLLGTYAAGQALSDAGLAEDEELKSKVHLLVAAGTGERDPESDQTILSEISALPADEPALNRLMMDTLRPTLFLSQLSNLLAGNISIVHRVTGSSMTFMGAEMAGVSVVENAVRRIHSGRDKLFLVGGSFVAARDDHLLEYVAREAAWAHPWRPVWERAEAGGGAVLGSVGAFLVIEASDHATERGANAYARIDDVLSDRTPIAETIVRALESVRAGPLAVLSGASGIETQTSLERTALGGVELDGGTPFVRAISSMVGLSREAHFPAGVALAAIAAQKRRLYDPSAKSAFEARSDEVISRFLVTASGQIRGSGAATLSAPNA